MSAELKNCPFCGGKARPIEFGVGDSFTIQCSECAGGLTRHYTHYQSAKNAWNTRTEKTNEPHIPTGK